MKPILMFVMASCPYCQAARRWMEEVTNERPEYKAIPLTIIDEVQQPELANTYDYHYVPTYYVDGVKAHEGAASKAIVERVFAAAMGDGGK